MKISLHLKAFLTLVVFLSFYTYSFSQKTEVYLNTYSGISSFRGDGATSQSSIIFFPFLAQPATYTLSPYGKRSGFCYSIGAQIQRVSKEKNIFGLCASFESLKSRVHINKVGVSGDPAYIEYPATGETVLKNTFVLLAPFAGHRYSYRKINFDLTAGFDFAFCTKSDEEGNAATPLAEYLVPKTERDKPSADVRIRSEVRTSIRKIGLLVGYSFGLTGYQSRNGYKAFTNVFRIGLSYLLK